MNFQDTSDMYARFTTTVLCNSLVQNAVQDCGLSSEEAEPLCADTCAEFARSEAMITSDDDLCSNPAGNILDLIRADFTNCALPEAALSGSTCISGIDNEPENCGYGNSTTGFCSYCAAGGINSTDTCCYNAQAEDRCQDVELPTLAQTMTFDAPTATGSPSSTASDDANNDDQDQTDKEDDSDDDDGLSGGAIAGIVIGSVAGLALLALLLFFCLRRRRNRGGSTKGSIFNQPSPARKGASMSMTQSAPQGYEVLPGGRIARMSALEGHSGESPARDHHHAGMAAGAMGAGAGYMAGRRKNDTSSSSDFGDSPASDTRGGVLRAPPTAFKRDGSLSSGSVLGSSVPQSPTSAGFSSPQGVASQQSEQLPFFKDYYSSDDIHPGDRVATLWAYQPRALDEFTLDRGDMLKVVGIWDDGWATGILLNERAEEWEARRQAQRDSGVSNTSGRRDSSPAASGEIKAFPLVCVCLPEHWRKTIEGDGSTESGSAPVIP